MNAKNVFLGAVFGLLIGGPAMLVSWATVTSQRDFGMWVAGLWVLGWVVWGAILGRVILRKKT